MCLHDSIPNPIVFTWHTVSLTKRQWVACGLCQWVACVLCVGSDSHPPLCRQTPGSSGGSGGHGTKSNRGSSHINLEMESTLASCTNSTNHTVLYQSWRSQIFLKLESESVQFGHCRISSVQFSSEKAHNSRFSKRNSAQIKTQIFKQEIDQTKS